MTPRSGVAPGIRARSFMSVCVLCGGALKEGIYGAYVNGLIDTAVSAIAKERMRSALAPKLFFLNERPISFSYS